MHRLQSLQRAFEQFAEDCHGTSPLYEFLSREIARDRDLLTLCKHRRPGQPPPNNSWTIPPVSERIGIDLHVNDVSKKADLLWLLSLSWPEHHERRNLF